MEKKKTRLYKARYILGIVFALSLIATAILNHSTEVYAAPCSICGGEWNGPKKTVKQATCTEPGDWRYTCSGCGQVGHTPHEIPALGHAWPSDYTYVTNNGIANGARYMNCTRCAGRLDTEYACYVYAGDGISTAEGTNWYDAGAAVRISATPLSGYAWDYWEWTGGGYGTDNPFTFGIDRAYQFFAYGHALDVTITYNANGGTQAPEDQVLHYDENNYISEVRPVRTGYTFKHWLVDLSAEGLSSTYKLQPGELYPAAIKGGTKIFVAQWEANDYTITLDPNGGTCQTESVNPRYDQDWYYCMSSHTPARKGYTFKGWYDAIEGGTQVYKPDGYCTNEGTYYVDNVWKYPGDVTLYARWEAIPRTVTYHANGGTTGNQERINYYDDDIDLSLTAEKSGYIFVGWNTDPTATTGLSSLKMQEEDITLYAIYSIAVSDIANHSYDENGTHIHTSLKELEVFLRIWELGNEENYQDYPLRYDYDVSMMVYRYVLDADVSDYVKNLSRYSYAVYAYDNAGNWTPIIADTPPPPPEEYFPQTVKHYRYDCIIGEYINFATTVEEKKAGERFQPLFLTNLIGYQEEKMEYPSGYTIAEDGSYVVTESATTKAYYAPIAYTLTFDANGGTTNVAYKNIHYGDYYGDMPTPVRKGHTFKGWYTEKTGGELVTSSDKYLLDSDSTLFAHWSINSYTVTYDYWTNGGTSVSQPQQSCDYGAQVDLSMTAGKSGAELKNWNFVGWNTNASATTGLSSYIMTDSDVTLYAIYRKDIKVTLVEQKDTESSQKTLSQTIYNNETDAAFQIANDYSWSGWTLKGWTTATGADEIPMYGNQATHNFMDNITLYALYVRDVTLSYDINGFSVEIEEQTKEAYHNAAGNSRYPTFVITSAPELAEHSFVNWKVANGMVQDMMGSQKNTCTPGSSVTVLIDTLLTATWDAHPKLEAYNRYFTLDQARGGSITEAELLRKVKATDEEAKNESNPEGALRNGTDVIVVEYTANTFTALTTDAEIYVTYEAKDGYGNIVKQTVTITVTDTTLVESPKKFYVRFISRRFLLDDSGNLLPESKGGLSETSTWRTNDNYRNLLINTLSNSNTDIETWVFTREDILEIKKKL